MSRDQSPSAYVRQQQNRMAARTAHAAARQMAADMAEDDDDVATDLTVADNDAWYPRMPKSAIRLTDVPRRSSPRDVVVHRVPRRASTLREKETEALPRLRPRYRLHWLVFVGLALIIMVAGWVLFTDVANWWSVTQDTWHYGYPRTSQCDAVVGHNHDSPANPTHFIALNLNGQVEVIEIPAGDAAKAKIYVGPSLVGTSANLAPVTLSFADVNGDGRLDLLIHVQGGQFVFINTGSEFRPAGPGDHITLPNP